MTYQSGRRYRLTLEEIELQTCPCGARNDSLNTHSHVGNCPWAWLIARVRELEPQVAAARAVSEAWESADVSAKNTQVIMGLMYALGKALAEP